MINMEESIRNAEKLIHAVNVALAQMKHEASYDDFNHIISFGGRGERKSTEKMIRNPDGGTPVLQSTTFPGVNEKLAVPDELFNVSSLTSPGMNTIFAVGEDDAKIEEINNKIEVYRQELMEREEKESMRAMHLEGLSKLSVGKSAECLAFNAVSASDASQKSPSLIRGKSNIVTVAEDLKSKLIQTQEIVDRGIQTARELNETVELLKTKPLKSDTCDENSINRVRKLENIEKIAEKSDSRSTLKSSIHKKCRKCNSEIICKKRNKDEMGKKEENVMVMNMRRKDSDENLKQRKLHTQRLPSLNIRGDLRCQKIPNVDILPGRCAVPEIHANTSFKLYSHEQILRDKFEKVVENVEKCSAICQSEKLKSVHTVKCSSCGKAIKIFNKMVLSEQIDELLKVCNYNVFDPRIDEFVEKCGAVLNEDIFLQPQENLNLSEYTKSAKESLSPRHSKNVDISKTKKEDTEKISLGVRKMKISELSNNLMRKYKEKAIELEEEHLQFENILRDLFKKVDESRQLFNNCDYLSKFVGVDRERQKSNLSITAPVILSYTGSGEEADDGKNAVMRRSKNRSRNKMEERKMWKKTGKRDSKSNTKLLSGFGCIRENKKVEKSENPEVAGKANKRIGFAPFHREKVDILSDIPCSEAKQIRDIANMQAVTINEQRSLAPLGYDAPLFSNFESPPDKESPSNPPVDSVSSNEEMKEAKDVSKNKANQSDYESDFEEETPEVRGITEVRAVPDLDNSLKYIPNLSTISEIDSEVDRKLSELIVSTEEEMENADKECHNENKARRDCSETEQSSIENASQRQYRKVILEDAELAARNAKDLTLSSSEDDDTTKLLKKVKRHLQEVSSQQPFYAREEPSRTEKAESLPETFGALKTQLEKSETLAGKLSVKHCEDEALKETETSSLTGNHGLPVTMESIGEDAGKRGVDFVDPSRKANASHVLEKRTIQKQLEVELDEKSENGAFKSDHKPLSPKSLFVITKSIHSRLQSESKSVCGDKSYSEGEISEQEIFCSEGSSSSIGEVISENDSDSSISDENSMLKFL